MIINNKFLNIIQKEHHNRPLDMHGVGFEPTKRYAADLKSDPFDHSGIRAVSVVMYMMLSTTWLTLYYITMALS